MFRLFITGFVLYREGYIGPDIFGNNIHFQTLSSNNTPGATGTGSGAGLDGL